MQASPFTSAGAAPAGGGSSPSPPSGQDGGSGAQLGAQTWLAVFLRFSLVLRAGSQLCQTATSGYDQKPLAVPQLSLGLVAVSPALSLKADAVRLPVKPCLLWGTG